VLCRRPSCGNNGDCSRKRGLISTFHQVSKDYLPLYLAEFSYQHNNRQNPNIFADVIAK
jgi:hypothetical protein